MCDMFQRIHIGSSSQMITLNVLDSHYEVLYLSSMVRCCDRNSLVPKYIFSASVLSVFARLGGISDVDPTLMQRHRRASSSSSSRHVNLLCSMSLVLTTDIGPPVPAESAADQVCYQVWVVWRGKGESPKKKWSPDCRPSHFHLLNFSRVA